MDNKEQRIQELATKIRSVLPPSTQDSAYDLARLIFDTESGDIRNKDIIGISESNEEIRKITEALAGKTIKTEQTVIQFGESSQVGDVTVRDIAGSSVYYINFSSLAASEVAPRFSIATTIVAITGIIGILLILFIVSRYIQLYNSLSPGIFSILVLISASLTVIGSLVLGIYRHLTSKGDAEELRSSKVLILSAIISILFIGIFGLTTSFLLGEITYIIAGGSPANLDTASNLLVSIAANIIGTVVIFGLVSVVDYIRKGKRRAIAKKIRQHDRQYFRQGSTIKPR